MELRSHRQLPRRIYALDLLLSLRQRGMLTASPRRGRSLMPAIAVLFLCAENPTNASARALISPQASRIAEQKARYAFGAFSFASRAFEAAFDFASTCSRHSVKAFKSFSHSAGSADAPPFAIALS
jgi:hypothetical protein